eukprot:CAMPEP_0181224202 /NCGR_PEP_ID=MMETSP1096-20121128/30983_1 /TAXON_ID=156174 ORGANISM="Chrysochromulina ericina, Strain CCMP281" /NCGR_SAMPLE_ID=MMETSP1096 /ASSEMBLY_ACC=CAM_ASM_000453 /LENGTH=62 /DNA_ID=CAMNT_0023317233 /DNA_START=345 /DNA_END=533 /DNA_ORIENTATION=+
MSSCVNQRPSSSAAPSTESEPSMQLRPRSAAYTARTSSTIPRPVLMTSFPSQHMQTMGPEAK